MNRVKELRKQNNYSQQKLANALNVHQTAISQWETGRTSPDLEIAAKMAELFNVTIDYLLGHTDKRESVSPGRWIKVLGHVAAGIPIEAIEDVVDMEQLSPDMDPSFEYRGLVIKGDSMEPKMSEGDVVIVRIQDDVETGDVAIVFVNGDEATCKKIKKTPEGIYLLSFNPAYEPMFYSNREIAELPVRVFGRVVELRAKY